MKDFKIRPERRPVVVLLLTSLCLTIGRGITLPFMTIYLNQQYGMAVANVGLAMTFALTAGVLFSLGFGMLADRFDKKRYMLLAIGVFIFGFIGIPVSHSPMLAVVCFSVINCAYSVFSTVLKGYFSDTLAVASRPRIFSLNYTFINIGWSVGPPLATLVMMHSVHLPFWIAAIAAAIPFVFIQQHVPSCRVIPPADSNTTVRWSPRTLLHDRALRWFTLSNFLSSLVCGSFVSFLSQFVLVSSSAALAAKVVSIVLPVNALCVVTLQYWAGKRMHPGNLRKLMFIGSLCFSLSLLGFLWAGDNVLIWGIAAFVFTLGELIYIPGEYMLIDHIAPPGMKASYFSMQNLGNLGAAANPIITGYMLTWFPPWVLFSVLIVAIFAAWWLTVKGLNVSDAAHAGTVS